MNFKATFHPVADRGTPPIGFLAELVKWGKQADCALFAPNANPADIYALTKEQLGPWGKDIALRRAGMLEIMRVHAGFESSWNWLEGVDKTNKTSMAHIEGQETGIFQVSFDSTYIADGAMKPFAESEDIETPRRFIAAMKTDRWLALEYYARLVRVSVAWAGPLRRKEILPFLRRDAMAEFAGLLA